ncbi:MAG: hypothetical protein L3J89_10785 [Gammaproteobacteria bacterium]|nr:hypothetical protein [Gammaproteobacteria bacterium]
MNGVDAGFGGVRINSTDETVVKRPIFDDVSSLLAHEGSAILIDKIISCGESDLVALVEHKKKSLYSDAQGNVPIWVGLEYMAQTIGAFAGVVSRQNNEPIRIGLLLGVRQYLALASQFTKNSPVEIKIEEIFRDETNLAMFGCEIRDCNDGHVMASAQIKAILSSNIDEIPGEIKG